MSRTSQESVKASLCEQSRPDSEYSFSSSYHKVTKKTLEMYNPAKISKRRTPPEAHDIQFTVSVINIAMHYIYLQLISVFIYYTLKNQTTKHSIFLNFTFLIMDIFSAFFSFFFEKTNLKHVSFNRA